MITIHALTKTPKDLARPIALTIGSFDGIHLGHQSIFDQLRAVGKTSVVLTFTNHPSTILGDCVTPIYSPEQKNALIATYNIDVLIDLPFTKETATQTYQDYLKAVRKHLPFSYLVLGEDARLGKDRLGTPEAIKIFAKEQDFQVIYLPKLCLKGAPISSRHIRQAIASKDFSLAQAMLGRNYPTERL